MADKRPSNFSEADFFSIRDEVRRYLSSVHEFKDFNFEGSAISTLVDALAYTANHMAVHSNMSLSEIFLDSAQIRENAVSRAKLLGYFPRQITSSKATLNLRWEDPSLRDGLEVILREGARFSSRSRSSTQKGFEFVTFEPVKLEQIKNEVGDVAETGVYEASIDVNEGKIVSQTFTYPTSFIERPTFEIRDRNVDPDYMIVTVTSPSSDVLTYQRFIDVTDVDNETAAFFLQESERGRVSVYFGDGSIGIEPDPGSSIEISYLKTSGVDANGSTRFELDDADGTLYIVGSPVEDVPSDEVKVKNSTVVSSFGADQESIESIRFSAPRFFASQNRAVTVNDYKALLTQEFGFLESLSVWGGENNNPPAYGKVFISAKPTNGLFITPSIKRKMRDIILDRLSIITITPEIVDADPVFADLQVRVQYDSSRTLLTLSDIIDTVRAAIEEYFRISVTSFSSRLRASRLLEKIDDSIDAILGSVFSIKIRKELEPASGVERDYTLDFGNPLKRNTVRMVVKLPSGAELKVTDEDTNDGNLQTKINGSISRARSGKVDYESGKVDLFRFDPGLPEGSIVQISAVPLEDDLLSMREQIIALGNVSIDPQAYFQQDSLEETTQFTSEQIRR